VFGGGKNSTIMRIFDSKIARVRKKKKQCQSIEDANVFKVKDCLI
jgi:hypothetical protein